MGSAWLFQLAAELREWDDPLAQEMSTNLRPLEEVAVERLKTWLPKLSHPVRIGEHDQTAFGLGLMLDYARVTGIKNSQTGESKARQFFLADKPCPSPTSLPARIFSHPALARQT